MIKRLKIKDNKKIFITGGPSGSNFKRQEIALSLAEHFNYKCCSVKDLIDKEINKKLEIGRKCEKKFKAAQFVDDDIIIDLVRKELIKLEKEQANYIVEGFPKNRIQGMFLQSIGLLPDNIIILSNSHDAAEKNISEKLKKNFPGTNVDQMTKEALDQNDLNINSVRSIFKGFYSELNSEGKSKENILDEIAKIINFKKRTTGARKPPRILLLGPPCSRKYEIAQFIARKYNICHISVSELLHREIGNKNDNSVEILKQINNGELVHDKFVTKLLEDRLYASDAMINGWIITGFPKNKEQVEFLKNNLNFHPSLVVFLTLDDEYVQKKSAARRLDVSTGRVYYTDAKDFNTQLLPKLVVKNEDKPANLKKRLENWNKISHDIEKAFSSVLSRLNGDTPINQLIERISDSMTNAS